MSQYAEITRNGVDRAAPLDFPERRPAEPVTITAHVTFSGIHFEVCFSGQVDQLPALAKRLVALGAEPAAQSAPSPATNGKPTTSYADDGTPQCIIHGAMKESDKRPGTYYCPKKLADGTYCKSRG